MLGSRIRQQQQLLPLLLLILFVASNNGGVEGFTTLRRSFTAAFAVSSTRTATIRSQLKVSTTSATNTGEDNNKTPDSSCNSNDKYEHEYEPVFDFANPEEQAVSKFDRIDDAIMGGISTSQIRQSSSANNNNENDEECCFASWSGVCRTDGGGFCGTRTLPFQDGVPLRVGNGDGFYLKARLASDNEPERRVWKLTTRVENVQRSEQLYQAMFEIPKDDNENDDKDTPNSNEWKTIRVPFESFVQVRGPRIVANGPPLNVTGGLYQIGMTMSKFQIATNTTEFFNFRPGYFELQIKEIGVYSSNKVKEAETEASTATTTTSTIATTIETPMTLTKEEAKKKRPTALKILSPVAKVFFNEKRCVTQRNATQNR